MTDPDRRLEDLVEKSYDSEERLIHDQLTNSKA